MNRIDLQGVVLSFWPWILAAFACALGWVVRSRLMQYGPTVFTCDECGRDVGVEFEDGVRLLRPGTILGSMIGRRDLCVGCQAQGEPPSELRPA